MKVRFLHLSILFGFCSLLVTGQSFAVPDTVRETRIALDIDQGQYLVAYGKRIRKGVGDTQFLHRRIYFGNGLLVDNDLDFAGPQSVPNMPSRHSLIYLIKNGEFLVAWDEYIGSSPYTLRNWGRRFNSLGQITSPILDYTPGQNDSHNWPILVEHPIEDYIFYIYTRISAEGQQLHGAKLNSNGEVIELSRFNIDPQSKGVEDRGVFSFFDSIRGQFVVFWMDQQSGKLYKALVNPENKTPVTEYGKVAEIHFTWGNVHIGYDPNKQQYLMVWADSATDRLLGHFLGADFTIKSTNVRPISTLKGEKTNIPAVEYSPTSKRFLVAYSNVTNENKTSRAYGQYINSDYEANDPRDGDPFPLYPKDVNTGHPALIFNPKCNHFMASMAVNGIYDTSISEIRFPDVDVTYIGEPCKELAISSNSLNFGRILPSTTKTESITLTNYSPYPVDIGQATKLLPPYRYASDSCSNTTIAADGSCTIEVEFYPLNVDQYDPIYFNIPLSSKPESLWPTIKLTGTASNLIEPATLLTPSDGQKGVEVPTTFMWQQSTGAAISGLSFDLTYCENKDFSGCDAIQIEGTVPKTRAARISLSLLLGSLILLLSLRTSRSRAALISILLAITILPFGCSSDSTDQSGNPQVIEMSYEASDLKPNTEYFWKVVTKATAEVPLESATSSFVTGE
jgi:hypothetical protein